MRQRSAPGAAGFSTKRLRLGEAVIEKSIMLVSFVSLAVIALICIFVFREAAGVFAPRAVAGVAAPAQEMETYGDDPADTPLESATPLNRGSESQAHDGAASLLGLEWQPVSQQPRYGILPLLIGSFKVALIAMLIGGPLGVLAALFTTTFAAGWVRETVKPVIEILAGFPSVVIGFFALIVLASIMQNLFGYQYRLNALVGGVALSLAVIPTIFTLTEDALQSVPRSYVEASLALGAQKWETAILVVLPAATPGIFAAVLLGLGRAIGETMIVLMATGNAALLSMNPIEPVRTMSATIGAEMAEVVFGDFHYSALFFIGVVLFAVSFAINVIAETFVRGLLMRRFRGASA